MQLTSVLTAWWGCLPFPCAEHHLAGLVALVNKCRRLECINVGGMRVPPESFVSLLSISPALQIRSIPQILTAGLQVSS
ncbi:hypothetical protein HU200_015459 [Digitaria exilis]|uniref:Uncharacterized protein n=1 Tax=Digitaria exilis TaxID=1010633 RepID=A0A835KJM3_9POAL|nr:hypothetical protein HU200_015459 [Digitaria exilis]